MTTLQDPLSQRRAALQLAFERHPYDDDKAMALAPRVHDFLYGGPFEAFSRRIVDALIKPIADGDAAASAGDEFSGDVIVAANPAAAAMPFGPQPAPSADLTGDSPADPPAAPPVAPPADSPESPEDDGDPDRPDPEAEADEDYLYRRSYLWVLDVIAAWAEQGHHSPSNDQIGLALDMAPRAVSGCITQLVHHQLLTREWRDGVRLLAVTAEGLKEVRPFFLRPEQLVPADSAPSNRREHSPDTGDAPPATAPRLVLEILAARQRGGQAMPSNRDIQALLPQLARNGAAAAIHSLCKTGRLIKEGAGLDRVLTVTEAGFDWLRQVGACGSSDGSDPAPVPVSDAAPDAAPEDAAPDADEALAESPAAEPAETANCGATGRRRGEGSIYDGPPLLTSEAEMREKKLMRQGADLMSAALAGRSFEDDPRARRPEQAMSAVPRRSAGYGSSAAQAMEG